MKIEQITALKDAGFTAEQIVALAPILTDEVPKQEVPKQEAPKQDPPKQDPEKSIMEEMMSAMKKQFEHMMEKLK